MPPVTAIGLALGTYLNWLFVSKRLRRYSIKANNAITIPEFFSNRFKENKKVLMTIAAVFILIFFAVYTGSCFVTCGKLFNQLFGIDYILMMLIGACYCSCLHLPWRLPCRKHHRLCSRCSYDNISCSRPLLLALLLQAASVLL